MRFVKNLILAAVAVGSLALATVQADAKIGVVMMHGNGNWGGQFAPWVPVMAAAGYGFIAPDMCWADIRSYDHTPLECMADVDKAIATLKSQGYDQIVVGGHSMGGINALLYGAKHPGLAGVIVFAPSAMPRTNEDPKVYMARQLVAQGQGNAITDFNTSGINPLFVTPNNYLSFFGPESVLYDTELLPKLTAPLLWVAGTDDAGQKNALDRFKLAPSTPLNQFVLVTADHFATPDVATSAMMGWLADLQVSLDQKKQTN